MSTEFEISILRMQSEYITQLATRLTTTFNMLEQTLSAQSPSSALPTGSDAEQIAELQRLLATEAESLCKRIQAFLEQTSSPHTDALRVSQEANRIPMEQTVDSQPAPAAALQQGTSREAEFSQRVHALLEDSRAAMAFANQTFECTREVLRQAEEMRRLVHASRERAAEWKAQTDRARPGNPIVKEETSPPERIASAESSATNKTE